MKTTPPTPPAAESAPQTPRVTALVRELYRLKSNTLRYPCETALRQLAEELEKEHAAAQQRIGELEKALDGIVDLYVSGYLKPEADGPARFYHAFKQARLALRHPERT